MDVLFRGVLNTSTFRDLLFAEVERVPIGGGCLCSLRGRIVLR